MNKKEYKKMLKDGIETDGLQFCLDCLQEECAELITAISHVRRGRVKYGKIIMEMADVAIMSDMCRIGIDNEIGFNDRIKFKSDIIGNAIKFKKGVKNG